NEIQHDDPTQITQTNLTRDLLGRFKVGFDDGVFQAIGATDKLTGIHVNRDQGFGLIDHDVAAGSEPDARFDGLINLRLDAILFKNRRVFGVELDAPHELWREAVDEINDALILEFIIHADRGEIGRKLIAQDALHQIKVT